MLLLFQNTNKTLGKQSLRFIVITIIYCTLLFNSPKKVFAMSCDDDDCADCGNHEPCSCSYDCSPDLDTGECTGSVCSHSCCGGGSSPTNTPTPTPTPTPFPICGYVKDTHSGAAVPNINVKVNDGQNNSEIVSTDATGKFNSTSIVDTGEWYGVRPQSDSLPDDYKWPVMSTTTSWASMRCVDGNPDQTANSISYECQSMRYDDCTGDGAGTFCRCNFDITKRAYVLTRVRFGSDYVYSPNCAATGCPCGDECLPSNPCITSSTLSISCTNGSTTEVMDVNNSSSWACNNTGAYSTTSSKPFYNQDSITCTASNPPEDYLFDTWELTNGANSATSNACADDQSCEASFTADSGWFDHGDHYIHYLLRRTQLTVNIKDPAGNLIAIEQLEDKNICPGVSLGSDWDSAITEPENCCYGVPSCKFDKPAMEWVYVGTIIGGLTDYRTAGGDIIVGVTATPNDPAVATLYNSENNYSNFGYHWEESAWHNEDRTIDIIIVTPTPTPTPTPYVVINVMDAASNPVIVSRMYEATYTSDTAWDDYYTPNVPSINFTHYSSSSEKVGGKLRLFDMNGIPLVITNVTGDNPGTLEKYEPAGSLPSGGSNIDDADQDEANRDSSYYAWADASTWTSGVRNLNITVATPTPYISGGFYEYNVTVGTSGLDGVCSSGIAAASFDPEIEGMSLVNDLLSFSETDFVDNGTSYEILAGEYDDSYELTLSIQPPADPENAWSCACPGPENLENPFVCKYLALEVPQSEVNFYLINTNISNGAWWQILGGNAYAGTPVGNVAIRSYVPSTCAEAEVDDPTLCEAGVFLNEPNGTVDTAGYPITGGGSVESNEEGENWIHSLDRLPDDGIDDDDTDNAYADGVTIPVENYAHFYRKFGEEAQTIEPGQPSKPTIDENGQYIGYSDGNMIIDDSNAWSVVAGESIIIFVHGDLEFEDTSGSGAKLTEVEPGGFLAFIVSENITISPEVGYYDDPSTSAIHANANLEGVFIASGAINMPSNEDNDNADKKFIGAGTFVGWGGINLARNYAYEGDPLSAETNNLNPIDVFIYRPDFIINTPLEMKSANYEWQETAPRWN